MMERIKKRLLIFTGGRREEKRVQPLPRGRTHNVIVIKPRDEIFTQAIFIMRDDYFSSSALPQEELLNRAKEAAGICIPVFSSGGRMEKIAIIALSFLLAAETAALLLL